MGFYGSSVAVEVWVGCSVGCCFVKYVIICGCGCEGGCCGITVEDGGGCGWWCVLKGVVYGCVVWFVMSVVGKM